MYKRQLLYLAIAKDYEPLLLLPIAFGCIMANFPNTGFETDMGVMMAIGFGIKYEIFPPLIFMGVGAMTDLSLIHIYSYEMKIFNLISGK